ncbi:MAG: protein phosphatase 2C domain-containing protein, partial [Acidipropionibacterium acidipropionici]|nr:protein phosphatase 2C domain-containing protein [Acidipropionibacterium acidipropionici]
MVLSLDIRSHSEIGLVRKNNQDSGYVSPTMLVVADGMGGAAAGDLASTVAVRQVARADSHRTGEEMLEVLAGAVSAANDELADLVTWDHSLEGMGTTFCGVMFDGTQLGLVHIGDSRGYLYRDGNLKRMTHDHSWVQSLVDEGRITESEAAVHPHRSLLLKVLNGQPQHTPDTRLVDVHEGDRLLFCSDGLCGFVPDHVISEILGQESLDDAMALLITEAHAAGGSDNITIVLADVVAQDDALDAVEPKIIGAAAFTAVPEHEV